MLSRARRAFGTFAAVFRSPDLARVEAAFIAFGMAEWGTWVAILVYAYSRGGAGAAGLVAVIQLVPAMLFAPFAALLGDRYRRDRVLLAAYLAQACAMALTAAALAVEASLGFVYPLAALAATSITLTRPAQGAILPSLAGTPEELTAANVVAGTIESASMLLGPALAGVLLGIAGPALVFGVMAGLLVVGAALVAGIRPVRPADGQAGGAGAILAEAAAGFRDLVRSRGTGLVVVLTAAKSVVIGALDVLLVVLAISVLEIGEAGAGYLNAALGAGGVLGGIAALSLVGRRRLAPPLASGLGLFGIPVCAVGVVAAPLGAGALVLAGGAGQSLADVAGRTLLQRIVRDDVLTRVFGILEGLHMGALAIGSALAPVLASAFGVGPALLAVGGFLPLLVGLSWRSLARADAGADVDVERLRLLASVPILSALPPPTLERIAARFEPRDLPRGTVVIREGEEGDRFYVVERGAVRVAREGREVARLGAGEAFGEIALLHDVPRTATVTASEPIRLLTLGREEFLEALTGHPASRVVAERVARDRMEPAR